MGKNRDGEADIFYSDEYKTLVVRGNYSKEEVITKCIEQDVIDSDCAEKFMRGDYQQSHYKCVAGWNYPRDTPCKGSYFASVVFI